MKLTAKDVEFILAKYEKGMSIIALAYTYGVSYELVRKIVRGKQWVKKLTLHRNRIKHEALLKARESTVTSEGSKDRE